MPTVNQEFIEEAKKILSIESLTLEERLNIIIYINLTRNNDDDE